VDCIDFLLSGLVWLFVINFLANAETKSESLFTVKVVLFLFAEWLDRGWLVLDRLITVYFLNTDVKGVNVLLTSGRRCTLHTNW
jgi:hypothetical protein